MRWHTNILEQCRSQPKCIVLHDNMRSCNGDHNADFSLGPKTCGTKHSNKFNFNDTWFGTNCSNKLGTKSILLALGSQKSTVLLSPLSRKIFWMAIDYLENFVISAVLLVNRKRQTSTNPNCKIHGTKTRNFGIKANFKRWRYY